MTTYILSDAERYGDIERILAASEPLCMDPVRYRHSHDRPRRALLFGLGWRTPARSAIQPTSDDIRKRG